MSYTTLFLPYITFTFVVYVIGASTAFDCCMSRRRALRAKSANGLDAVRAGCALEELGVFEERRKRKKSDSSFLVRFSPPALETSTGYAVLRDLGKLD